jgi:neutral ceramidase
MDVHTSATLALVRRLLVTFFILPATLHAGWQVGVSKVDITPATPVPLAGYGGATRMSQQVLHPIWIKALAIKDDRGDVSVLVTSDLVGLSPTMVDIIVARAKQEYQLPRERLILNYSHNHSCPVTADVLWLYYDLSAAEKMARDQYTEKLYDQYIQAIGDAIASMSPAVLEFEQGLAGFAVNRRRSRPNSRGMGGQVDHDVPVLAVRKEEKIYAVVFGYSCHTTALSGKSINGDYAGFAQIAIEKDFPGCTALFVQNCGGDANPLPRVMTSDESAAVELASMYGHILSVGVRQVLVGKMKPLSGPLVSVIGQTQLSFQPGPTFEQLKDRLPRESGMVKRETENLIRIYETEGKLRDQVDYPIQVWRFGNELTLIALTGETVVDYSLRFKQAYGWDTTWVAGYNNDLLSYVPSLRVLREGGYEGTTGIFEYGHRAPYTESVEQKIADEVELLIRRLAK